MAIMLILDDKHNEGHAPAPEAPAGSDLDVRALARSLLESNQEDIYRKVMVQVDRVLLEETLRHTRGNQVRASDLLGLSRTTLRSKLKPKPEPSQPPAIMDG